MITLTQDDLAKRVYAIAYEDDEGDERVTGRWFLEAAYQLVGRQQARFAALAYAGARLPIEEVTELAGFLDHPDPLTRQAALQAIQNATEVHEIPEGPALDSLRARLVRAASEWPAASLEESVRLGNVATTAALVGADDVHALIRMRGEGVIRTAHNIFRFRLHHAREQYRGPALLRAGQAHYKGND